MTSIPPDEPQSASQPEPLPFDLSLVPSGERVLAAVSGGADSMALLLALRNAGRETVVAHVNHGLRGIESDADAAFVQEHCARLGLPCLIERLNWDASEPINEGTLREARYKCLERLARIHHCSRVATGHTASDLLETVLLFWLRGAAVTGLGGIEPRRAMGHVLLVRPLLGATREQTRTACVAAEWQWREDASNEDVRWARNQVRRELVPLLEELVGGTDAHQRLALQTARAARLWRADVELLDIIADEQLVAVTLRDERTKNETGIKHLLVLDGVAFKHLHVAMQRRVLRAAVSHLQGDKRDLSAEQLERARRHIVEDKKRAVWQWKHGLNVEWTGAMAGNRIRLWLVLTFDSAA